MSARTAVSMLCAVMLLVFLATPLLHSAVAHSHSADHHAAPSVMWGDLHGSLRHDDKQLLATVELMLATFLSILAFIVLIPQRAAFSGALSLVRARDEALHSGREQYRRFG